MTAPVFVDTNALIYALDEGGPEEAAGSAPPARGVVERAAVAASATRSCKSFTRR